MKFDFEVAERHPTPQKVNRIVAVVVPFWTKRDDRVYTQHLQHLRNSANTQDSLLCSCHFDGSEFFGKGSLLKSGLVRCWSERLSTELKIVSATACAGHRPPNSSLVHMESRESSSDFDFKDHVCLPIVFIAHSLASWVVRHLLSGASTDNTSIMFATRGVLLLDTPHRSLVASLEPNELEEYLKGLSAFLRGKASAHASMPMLAEELTNIDRAFERRQNSKFVREKALVKGRPAVATKFSEIWTTRSESGVVVFAERDDIWNKYGLSRLRKLLGVASERKQLERTGQCQRSYKLDLDALLENILEIEEQRQEHHTDMQSLTPKESILPPETALLANTPTRAPESIPEEEVLSTAPHMRKQSQSSVRNSGSTSRLRSLDPLDENMAMTKPVTEEDTALTRQATVGSARRSRQNRWDSSSDAESVTSNQSNITQPFTMKHDVQDPAYGDAYREAIGIANFYYQRADFINARAAFQRGRMLLDLMGPSVQRSYEFIAIDQQLAAISMYQGHYSGAKAMFEGILETTHGLNEMPTVQKRELIQDLRRWGAVVLLHQGKYNKAVSEFKALLDDSPTDDFWTTPGARSMLRMHVHRDLSLALAHLGQFSQVKEQIEWSKHELNQYYQAQESILQTADIGKQQQLGEALMVPDTDGVKPNTQDRIAEKPIKNIQKKRAVKLDYLRFVQGVIDHLWGSYDRALGNCKEALNGLELRLGGRHMKTLECASLKALLLAKNNRLSEAEICCNQTLHIMRKELGQRHPHTLETTGHLIYIFTSQYRLVEAISTALSLQTSTKIVFGDNHPQTLSSRLLLSQARLAAGDYSDALWGLQDVVTLSRNLYGEGNLITLTHTATFARVLHHAGALKEAERAASLALQRQMVLFSIPKGLGITTKGICISFQELTRDRLRAMYQNSDDWRIHPLFLFTLETYALIELSKPEPDRFSAKEILESCWKWKLRVLGQDHAFTLAAEYEFAMTFKDAGEEDQETRQRQIHMENIHSRRITILKDTHPDVLTARRELLIINCALSPCTSFSDASDPGPDAFCDNEAVEGSWVWIDTSALSKAMDDDMWASAASESQKIFSLHKVQLGGSHPETLKSHLWLFQLQLQLGYDVEERSCMRSLLSELRQPTILHQRLVDSIRIRHQMTLALLYSGHLRQAAHILYQIPEDIKASSIVHNPIFADTLEQLEKANQQNIMETNLEAQKHKSYKTRLHELRSTAETSNNTSEARSRHLEAFELCELLYGPDHDHTLKARENVARVTWDPKNETQMRNAIEVLSELIATLKTVPGAAQLEDVNKLYEQWTQQLARRTNKEVDVEDD